jgi:CHASE2 domain-containing sensor protein
LEFVHRVNSPEYPVMSQLEPSINQPSIHKRAILRCDGALEEGFRVALEVSDRSLGLMGEVVGELPVSLDLINTLERWRQSYRASLSRGTARISLESVSVETGSLLQLEQCRNLSKTLEAQFKDWLAYAGFQTIEQRLRESLNINDEVEVLLRTRDTRLYQLPWHCWGFIQRYPKAELVLSVPSERLDLEHRPHPKVRILAILGDRRGIDTDADRQILQKTPNAEVMFLVEPSRQFLYRYLWEQSWDILFFAGHSHTADQQGILNINSDEQLSLEDLKYGLKKAINRGLQLAIFNSCDGLGLAYELEQLHIPQFIVMREPVPDRVAQEFLKRFLQTFSTGESLHTSVRHAREWLHSLEGEFPCASWLPMLFQNPAMEPLNWQRIIDQEPLLDGSSPALSNVQPNTLPQKIRTPIRRLRLRGVMALSLLVGGLVLGGRSIGWLNQAELWNYDWMAQLQFRQAVSTDPSKNSDMPKIRVIGITQQDTQKYAQAGMKEPNVISDRALTELITKINRYQPRVIGLDIARDTAQPNPADYQQLLKVLDSASGLVVACKVGEDDVPGQQAIPSLSPPKLTTPKLVGYADSLIYDMDGIVRRYGLQMEMRERSTCKTEDSFAWQVIKQAGAEQILRKKIELPADFGGYQGDPLDFGEAQVLINYHRSNRNIKPYSLQDILLMDSQDELQQLFENNIVMIGYNMTNEDVHSTAIGTSTGVMIHTHVVRQLLQQTPQPRTWPQWLEAVWTIGWVLLGGGLLWRVRQRSRQIILTIGCVLMIQIWVYLAWLQSLWISAIPAILALLLLSFLVWSVEEMQTRMNKR